MFQKLQDGFFAVAFILIYGLVVMTVGTMDDIPEA